MAGVFWFDPVICELCGDPKIGGGWINHFLGGGFEAVEK